jgi:hypothetical protein
MARTGRIAVGVLYPRSNYQQPYRISREMTGGKVTRSPITGRREQVRDGSVTYLRRVSAAAGAASAAASSRRPAWRLRCTALRRHERQNAVADAAAAHVAGRASLGPGSVDLGRRIAAGRLDAGMDA